MLTNTASKSPPQDGRFRTPHISAWHPAQLCEYEHRPGSPIPPLSMHACLVKERKKLLARPFSKPPWSLLLRGCGSFLPQAAAQQVWPSQTAHPILIQAIGQALPSRLYRRGMRISTWGQMVATSSPALSTRAPRVRTMGISAWGLMFKNIAGYIKWLECLVRKA